MCVCACVCVYLCMFGIVLVCMRGSMCAYVGRMCTSLYCGYIDELLPLRVQARDELAELQKQLTSYERDKLSLAVS